MFICKYVLCLCRYVTDTCFCKYVTWLCRNVTDTCLCTCMYVTCLCRCVTDTCLCSYVTNTCLCTCMYVTCLCRCVTDTCLCSYVTNTCLCRCVTFPLILTERLFSVSGQSRHICKDPKCYGNRCLPWSHTAECHWTRKMELPSWLFRPFSKILSTWSQVPDRSCGLFTCQ